LSRFDIFSISLHAIAARAAISAAAGITRWSAAAADYIASPPILRRAIAGYFTLTPDAAIRFASRPLL